MKVLSCAVIGLALMLSVCSRLGISTHQMYLKTELSVPLAPPSSLQLCAQTLFYF